MRCYFDPLLSYLSLGNPSAAASLFPRLNADKFVDSGPHHDRISNPVEESDQTLLNHLRVSKAARTEMACAILSARIESDHRDSWHGVAPSKSP